MSNSLYECFRDQFQYFLNRKNTLMTSRMGWGKFTRNRSVSGRPLKINGRIYEHGFGDHAQSEHTVRLISPGKFFEASVGLHDFSLADDSCVSVKIEINGKTIWASPPIRRGEDAVHMKIDLHGAESFVLKTVDTRLPENSRQVPSGANVDWINPKVALMNGDEFYLQDISQDKSLLPTFLYGEEELIPIDLCLWNKSAETQNVSHAGYDSVHWVYTAPDALLRVHLTARIYKNFPAVEWLSELENIGEKPTGIIKDFAGLCLETPVSKNEFGESSVAVRRLIGSKKSASDFQEERLELKSRYPFSSLEMNTDEGRSSAAWLPFFGVDIDDKNGFNIGIGWSGAWKAEFLLENGNLQMKAGMQETNFRLQPGEKIRQPSILFLAREDCSISDGQNLLRRFILEYHSPRDSRGELIKTPISYMVWGGMTTNGMMKNIEMIRKHNLPYTTFWMDAGWYGPDGEKNPDVFTGPWYKNAGNWRINRTIHPEGLAPVTERARAAGMKTLLWVEIERAVKGTPVTLEHPEWFLSTDEDSGNLLLNLGNDDACGWAIETISSLIRENKLDCYRQDFNFNTIPHWKQNDSSDRRGISEAKYIAGLYRFWDMLRERFPDLLIDNCASGGRRIDLETISRSIALWRSDMQGELEFPAEVNQIEVGCLTQWIPLHAGGTWLKANDTYDFLSAVASGVTAEPFTFEYQHPADDYPFEWHRRMLEHARRMGEFFYHDFYLLTENIENPKAWYAYQCHRKSDGCGFFAVFRRPSADEESIRLSINELNLNSTYRLEDENGETICCSGKELNSFPISLPSRGCKLYYYARQECSC